MPVDRRTFTVLDGTVGPIVYRVRVSSLVELVEQLRALDLTPECARDAAHAAWGGCAVGFDGVALSILPGDFAAVYAEYQAGPSVERYASVLEVAS